jgi:hypothetical protein
VVGQQQKRQSHRLVAQKYLKVKGVCYLYKRESWTKQVMRIIHAREIKQLFYHWAYCDFYVCFELKIERMLCYSGSKPSLTSQLLQDTLTTLEFLVIGWKIKCYGCAQGLSSQLQIDWSKSKFNLIFLWHSGWSLELVICSSKKLNYVVHFGKKFPVICIWYTFTTLK